MKRQRASSVAVVLALWAGAVNAEPADDLPGRVDNATWIPVEARNHVTGASGPAAVLFGIARERGHSRPASLRVECFDGVTAVHVDADGLRLGSFDSMWGVIEVRLSFDGGRFVAGAWQPAGDGTGLTLSADQAVQFASGLYGKGELRLAVVRPLSVPFLFTFAVAGAEPALRALADRCHWSAGPAISDAGR